MFKEIDMQVSELSFFMVVAGLYFWKLPPAYMGLRAGAIVI